MTRCERLRRHPIVQRMAAQTSCQETAPAARRMRSVVTPGWKMIGTCDALTVAMWACGRRAMNHWVAGGIAWSFVETRYHDEGRLPGRVAGGLGEGRNGERSLLGPHEGRRRERKVAGERVVESTVLDVEIRAFTTAGQWVLTRVERVGSDHGAGVLGDEALQRLAGVGHERGDVDQRLDVGVAGRGVGDDRATVGVSDEDDRPADAVQDAGEVRGVRRQAAQRVGRRDDGVAALLQSTTLFQLAEASAKPPCTSTTVGFGVGVGVRTVAWAEGAEAIRAAAAARVAAAPVNAEGRSQLRMDMVILRVGGVNGGDLGVNASRARPA